MKLYICFLLVSLMLLGAQRMRAEEYLTLRGNVAAYDTGHWTFQDPKVWSSFEITRGASMPCHPPAWRWAHRDHRDIHRTSPEASFPTQPASPLGLYMPRENLGFCPHHSHWFYSKEAPLCRATTKTSQSDGFDQEYVFSNGSTQTSLWIHRER